MRSKIAFGLVWLLLGGALFWALLERAYPQAQPYPQQCVTNALAGGTVDAITVAPIPCALTTNILLLTVLGPNTATAPTIQPLGLQALTITRDNGDALQVGDMGPAGYVAILTSVGTSWILLNPYFPLFGSSTQPAYAGSCAVSNKVGGRYAGSFKASGSCSSGNVVFNYGASHATTNGFACYMFDMTTPADTMSETLYSTTSVTFSGSMANLDQMVWGCTPF